jgi:hypothetical protein
MHPWLKIRENSQFLGYRVVTRFKYKKARLKSVSKPGRETAPGFSLGGRQRWGAQQIFLEMPNTTSAWCTCDLCATCDFWTLKRDSCIKRYPSGVYPSPARETAPGFSLVGRGAPQKRLGFLRPQRRGPKRKRFLPAASPHPNPKNQQRSEENAAISERPKRKSGRPAAGLAQPRDEHGAEPARGRGGKHCQACRPAGPSAAMQIARLIDVHLRAIRRMIWKRA